MCFSKNTYKPEIDFETEKIIGGTIYAYEFLMKKIN